MLSYFRLRAISRAAALRNSLQLPQMDVVHASEVFLGELFEATRGKNAIVFILCTHKTTHYSLLSVSSKKSHVCNLVKFHAKHGVPPPHPWNDCGGRTGDWHTLYTVCTPSNRCFPTYMRQDIFHTISLLACTCSQSWNRVKIIDPWPDPTRPDLNEYANTTAVLITLWFYEHLWITFMLLQNILSTFNTLQYFIYIHCVSLCNTLLHWMKPKCLYYDS